MKSQTIAAAAAALALVVGGSEASAESALTTEAQLHEAIIGKKLVESKGLGHMTIMAGGKIEGVWGRSYRMEE